MNKQKILLIEDDTLLHKIYKDKLEKAGYVVLGSFDGEEGIQLVKDNPDAALVLLDVILPSMHGVDILRMIKSDEKTKHIQVVMLTNLGDEGIMREAISRGAQDYLKKDDVPPENLISYINKYLTDPPSVAKK